MAAKSRLGLTNRVSPGIGFGGPDDRGKQASGEAGIDQDPQAGQDENPK